MKKILFFIILILYVSCNNSEGSKDKISNNSHDSIIQKTKENIVYNKIGCDTLEILNKFRNILLEKEVNKIQGYENIPSYLIDFYMNKEPEEVSDNSLDEQNFRDKYVYIFSNDFLQGLSMVNLSNINNLESFNLPNNQSSNFIPDVNYDFKFNYNYGTIKISLIYKFSSDDNTLDSETAIIYMFKIVRCEVVIDNIIMAG